MCPAEALAVALRCQEAGDTYRDAINAAVTAAQPNVVSDLAVALAVVLARDQSRLAALMRELEAIMGVRAGAKHCITELAEGSTPECS